MDVFVSKEQRAERLKICKGCPSLTNLNMCRECGCLMTAKTFLANQSCPIGKWQAITIVKKNKNEQ